MGLFSLVPMAFDIVRGKGNKAKIPGGPGPRGNSDPYFETIERTDAQTGKIHKENRRREAPEWFSPKDAQAWNKAAKWGRRYDMGIFSIGGFALGIETLVGLIPEIGDFIGIFLALHVYWHCRRIEGGLPADIKRKMKRNIMLDFLIGLVPLLGDIADGFFKSNTKNVMLLEAYLRKKHGPKGHHNKQARWSAGLRLHGDHPQQAQRLHDADIRPHSHPWDDYEDEVPPLAYNDPRAAKGPSSERLQQRPAQTAPPAHGKQQSFVSKWFGSTSQQRPADPEAGQGRWNNAT